MAKATAKYIRMTPRKVRRVINAIRGQEVSSARTMLKFMPYAAAPIVHEVLKSAIANAKENDNLNPDELKVSQAFVNDAPVYKRWRAMSRGRGYQILKRNSHITVEVESTGEATPKKKAMPKAAKDAVKAELDKQADSHTLTVDQEEEKPKAEKKSKPKKTKKEKSTKKKEESSAESKSKKKGKDKK